jgi:hypothetical protein
MEKIGKGALALTLVGGLALFSAPSMAGKPDVDSSAGPELPAPRQATRISNKIANPER